jgi:Penicillin-insensitive murein endopeptidase
MKHPIRNRTLPLAALAAVCAAVAATALAGTAADPPPGPGETAPVSTTPIPQPIGDPAPGPARPGIDWRRSRALGTWAGGRLVRGVGLPAESRDFFTWDPVQGHRPNRPWRRFGTDRLIRLLVRVAREDRLAHPDGPRIAIGDLSRPHGGDFGPRFGGIGHASHQNGLDADVYYPRADGRERVPRYASQIDRPRSQELVRRFLAHGALMIFVGPNTGLTGPPRRVQVLVNHDNHLHVRLPE